jgi:hypothetical protein
MDSIVTSLANDQGFASVLEHDHGHFDGTYQQCLHTLLTCSAWASMSVDLLLGVGCSFSSKASEGVFSLLMGCV